MLGDPQAILRQVRDALAEGNFAHADKAYRELEGSPLWSDAAFDQLKQIRSAEDSDDYARVMELYMGLMSYLEQQKSETVEDDGLRSVSSESVTRLQELLSDGVADMQGLVIDSKENIEEAWLISRLFEHAETRQLEAGSLICVDGAPADRMWLLSDGTVDVVLPNGKPAHLSGTPMRPSLIGELGYFTKQRRSATLCCASDVQLQELAYDEIDAALQEDPDLSPLLDNLFRRRLVLQLLSKHDIFKLLNDVDRRRIAHTFSATELKPGEILIEKGKEYPAAYLVQSGLLMLVSPASSEEEKDELIGSLHPGDFFNLGGLLRGVESPCRIVAGTDCHLLRLPRSSIEPFMLKRPWLVQSLLKLSRRPVGVQAELEESKKDWAADRQFDLENPTQE